MVRRQHLRSGLIVLGPPMRVLYMDPTARHLLMELARQGKGTVHVERTEGPLPRSLAQVCTKVFQHLREKARLKDWAPLEVKECLGEEMHLVHIHGFGIPSPKDPERARVVLLMEAIDGGKEQTNQQPN